MWMFIKHCQLFKYGECHTQRLPVCCQVLDAEKQFMDAAKRNDVESMKTLSRGLNANAKNVVSLKQTVSQYTALFNISQTDNFGKTLIEWITY